MAGVWLTLARFVGESRLDLPIVPTTESCSGGTYIVTGANVGLGFETAKHLVGLGAGNVILAVRDIRAGEAAMASIEEATHKRNVMEVWPLDLANLNSVKAMAQRAINELDRIDSLIENAGIALMSKDKWVMAEGHESSITVNVIGTLLLAVMLLPKMMDSARRFRITPHLVIVTSGVGFTAKSELDKIKEDPFMKMGDRELADMSQRYATLNPCALKNTVF
jgi:NAD(P)-dependent dehydrogenase (short-subunit alcohol dehydrogenase family)